MKKSDYIPDKNPFKVPENYFEEVNRKIISLTTEADTVTKEVSIFSRFRTSLLVAASVAGLILISYTAIKFLTPARENSIVSETLNKMSPDSYVNDIDLSALEENASSLILDEEGPDVSKNDIIDYLLRENVDLNDIYAQL
jgi:hypothetical protein